MENLLNMWNTFQAIAL